MSDSWQQLLAYRTRARAWVDRQVGLADTRLRVARLLDVGFDYSWDEVEADFEILGHRADFLVRLADVPWGIVMVQPMGTGLCATPPPEAFVMADGAGVSWCWLTDGLVIQLYHVGVDLVLSRIMHCDLLADDEADLRAFWRLLCREGVSSGRLEQHRQDRERPDHEAVRLALLTPEVLTALQTELARDFRRPGETSDLAGMVAWLCRVPPTPPIPGGDGDRGAAAACSDPAGAHLHEPSLMLAIGPNGCLAGPEDAVHGEAADDGLTWLTPSGQVDPPHLLGDDTGESLEMAHDTPLPVSQAKRQRRGGWRLLEADEMTTGEGVAISDIPESEPVADTDLPEPLASDATELALSEPADMPDVDPSTAARHDLSIHELAAPATMAVPGPERDRSEPIIQNDHEPSPGSVAIPTANDAGDSRLPTATKAPTPDRTATSQAPERATGAAPPARNESILSTLARQRQTHDRLRQNLRDLRENRVKLQDALSELQQDYPERFERMAAGESPKGARQATESQKPASWTLLGHLQSLGHGYWEWSAADGAGPSVRLN